MNYLDIVIIVLLLWGLARGFIKGLIIQVASILALVLGVYCSLYFSHEAIPYIQKAAGIQSKLVPILSFAGTFVVVIVGVYLLGKSIEKLVDIIALGLVNKLLGAFFGLIKTLLILSVALSLLNQIDTKINYLPASFKKDSVLHDPLVSFAPLIIPGIKTLAEKYSKED